MFQMLLAVIAVGGSALPVSPPTYAVQASACTSSTDDGRRVVENYTGLRVYESQRVRAGVPRTEPNQVRVLTGAQDADTCTRMKDALEQQARRYGRSARGVPLEFYQVGAFYFAVRTVPPSTCKPGPRHACVDLRWRGLHIFDQKLNRIESLRF